MAETNSMFKDQLQQLRSLVNQTASTLSQSRPQPNSSTHHSLSTSTSTALTATATASSLSLLTTHEINKLRSDFEQRNQTTRDLVVHIEHDIKAGKVFTEDTADRLARVTSQFDRLSDRLRIVEARQQEIWNTLQQRPTRNEVNSTVSATLLPNASYTKTRLNALAESVSALQAAFDARGSSDGSGGSGGSGQDNGVGSGTSMSFMEQRLERRMEDFIERKMRLRSRQLELDVVSAVKKSMAMHHMMKAQVNQDGQQQQEQQEVKQDPQDPQDPQPPDENESAVGNETTQQATSLTTVVGKSATAKELELVQEKFSKEVRLVQNSLVSLRTQLRMLGKDVKLIKKKGGV